MKRVLLLVLLLSLSGSSWAEDCTPYTPTSTTEEIDAFIEYQNRKIQLAKEHQKTIGLVTTSADGKISTSSPLPPLPKLKKTKSNYPKQDGHPYIRNFAQSVFLGMQQYGYTMQQNAQRQMQYYQQNRPVNVNCDSRPTGFGSYSTNCTGY
jgi:hypothetical protein